MLRELRAVISNSIQVAVEYGINAGTGGDGGRCGGGLSKGAHHSPPSYEKYTKNKNLA